MKLKSVFLLTSKKLLLITISWVVAVLLHNFVYGLFQDFFDSHETDEPFFFIIAISILFESYIRMPLSKYYAEPDDVSFTAINLLYMTHPFRIKSVNIFLGGGIGGLKLSKYERTDDPSWRYEPYAIERGTVYNLKAGINIMLFWKIGFYAVTKYIYSKKKENGVKVIDLSGTSVLVGFTFNFGLF